MSRGWVPYGKHATLVCWDLVTGKEEVRVQRPGDGLDTFACRCEAVGRSPEERGRRRAFWILELGGLCPGMAPADGEVTHGRHLQQEEGCKSVGLASCRKSQEKSHQMQKFPHCCIWLNGDICWTIPVGGDSELANIGRHRFNHSLERVVLPGTRWGVIDLLEI